MRFTKYKMQQTFPCMKYKRWAVFLKWTKQFAVKAVLPIQDIFPFSCLLYDFMLL